MALRHCRCVVSGGTKRFPPEPLCACGFRFGVGGSERSAAVGSWQPPRGRPRFGSPRGHDRHPVLGRSAASMSATRRSLMPHGSSSPRRESRSHKTHRSPGSATTGPSDDGAAQLFIHALAGRCGGGRRTALGMVVQELSVGGSAECRVADGAQDQAMPALHRLHARASRWSDRRAALPRNIATTAADRFRRVHAGCQGHVLNTASGNSRSAITCPAARRAPAFRNVIISSHRPRNLRLPHHNYFQHRSRRVRHRNPSGPHAPPSPQPEESAPVAQMAPPPAPATDPNRPRRAVPSPRRRRFTVAKMAKIATSNAMTTTGIIHHMISSSLSSTPLQDEADHTPRRYRSQLRCRTAVAPQIRRNPSDTGQRGFFFVGLTGFEPATT